MIRLVSKNALPPRIGIQPVELEAGRQASPHLPYPLQGLPGAAVAGDFKPAAIRDPDFDLVALFEFERFHYGRGQPDRQTVSPLGYLHRYTFILYIKKGKPQLPTANSDTRSRPTFVAR